MNCKSSFSRNKKRILKKSGVRNSSISIKGSKGISSRMIYQKSNNESKIIGSGMKRVIKKEITKNVKAEKPVKRTYIKKNISSKLSKTPNKRLIDKEIIKKTPEMISKDTSIEKKRMDLKSTLVKVVKKIDKRGSARAISEKLKVLNPIERIDVSKSGTSEVGFKNVKTSSKLINKASRRKTRICRR